MRPVDADRFAKLVKKVGEENDWLEDEIGEFVEMINLIPTMTDKEIEKWLNSKH